MDSNESGMEQKKYINFFYGHDSFTKFSKPKFNYE